MGADRGIAGQEGGSSGGGFQGPGAPICPFFKKASADWLYPVTGYCLGLLEGKLMIPSIAEYRELCTTEQFQSCRNYLSKRQTIEDKEPDARSGA